LQDGKNALHHAAAEGQERAIEWLITKGFAVDSLTPKGLTAFHLAAFKGHKGAAQLLAAAGCDTLLTDATGRTALHLGCMSGAVELVSWLVTDAGCSLEETTSEGLSAVHFAAMSGSLGCLEWLLMEAGASAECATHAGTTPLHLAAMKGHTETVQWLLAPPPEGPGLSVATKDLKKRTALHLAVVNSFPDTVRFLLDAGGDPSAADATGKSAISLSAGIMASGPPAGGPAEHVRDLITAASSPPPPVLAPAVLTLSTAGELGLLGGGGEAEEGEVQDSQLARLPEPGYGVGATRAWVRWEAPETPPAGKPALEYSLQWAGRMQARMGIGWTDATLLLEGQPPASSTPATYACVSGLPPSSSVSIRVRARNALGWGAYGKAEEISTGKEEGEGAAVGAGSAEAAAPTPIEPAVVVPLLSTSICEAATRGDIGALEAAEVVGEDVRGGIDERGRSVAHHAASGGSLSAFRWALGRGIPVDGRDKVGATPLLLATVGGFLPIVKAAVAGGAALEGADSSGYTALHYAALKGRPAIFKWLCEAGADPASRTVKGLSPRAVLEGRLAPPAPPTPPLTKEEAAGAGYMLSVLAAAESVPAAPPAPTLAGASRYGLLVELSPAKPVAGTPAPFTFELQYGRKGAMGIYSFFTALSDTLPTGVSIHKEGPAPPVIVSVPGLQPDGKYAAQVRARNARGWGPWSARSADMATLGSGDKGSPRPELMAAANATQVAAAFIATELAGGAGAKGVPGALSPALYFRPSEILADPVTVDAVPRPAIPTASASASAASAEAGPEDERWAGAGSVVRAGAAGRLPSLPAEAGGALVKDMRARLVALPAGSSFLAVPATAAYPAALLLDGEGGLANPAAVFVDAAVAAATGGRTRTIAWLLGSSEDAPDMGSPPAADSSAPSPPLPPAQAAALVALNAAACARDPDGRGLMHAAAMGGHVGTLRFVAAGLGEGEGGRARLAATLSASLSASGTSPTHLAAYSGQTDALGWLLALAGGSSAGGEGGERLAVAASSAAASAPDAKGWQPAHYAAAGGSVAALTLLGDMGADLAAEDAGGRTPAHLAAAGNAPLSLAFVASASGAAALARPDAGGMSPLHYAAAAGAGLAAAYLLAEGAGLGSSVDGAGRSVLSLASSSPVAILIAAWDGAVRVFSTPPVGLATARGGGGEVVVSWAAGRAALHALLGGPASHAVAEEVLGTILAASDAWMGATGLTLEWAGHRAGLSPEAVFLAASAGVGGRSGSVPLAAAGAMEGERRTERVAIPVQGPLYLRLRHGSAGVWSGIVALA